MDSEYPDTERPDDEHPGLVRAYVTGRLAEGPAHNGVSGSALRAATAATRVGLSVLVVVALSSGLAVIVGRPAGPGRAGA